MKYKIGDFSKITKISSRMLRYLDKENLLKPSFVDDNGYRYYSDSELEVVSKIIRLRKYEFSYSEIKDILERQQEDDPNVLNNKLALLKSVAKDYDKLVIELEQDHLESDSKMSNPYDVQIMNRPSFYALENRSWIKKSEIDCFLEKQVKGIYKLACTMRGNYYLTFFDDKEVEETMLEDGLLENNLFEDELLDVGFYQPIEKSVLAEDFKTIVVDEAVIISTIHYGCYRQIYKGYNHLYEWAQIQGYQVVGPFFEKYYVDAYFSSNPHEYVTEISVAVLKEDA